MPIYCAEQSYPAARYYANPNLKVDWPPEVHEYNEAFTKALVRIKKRHDPVVTTVAQGIFELKKNNQQSKQVERTIQTFLDRFYMSRIGIRVLIGQHIALNQLDPDPNYVGVICTNTSVRDVCQEAIDNALFVCEEHYGLFKGPQVQLACPDDLRFMYIPSHLVGDPRQAVEHSILNRSSLTESHAVRSAEELAASHSRDERRPRR